MVLHQPVHRWIFNVRAPYQREAEKVVTLLATTGLTRVALVYTNDSFGEDCATGARRGFDKAGLQPLFLATFDRARPTSPRSRGRSTSTTRRRCS
jgi:ABC-type branched-subunit amino acid transport system substrate-binding protein